MTLADLKFMVKLTKDLANSETSILSQLCFTSDFAPATYIWECDKTEKKLRQKDPWKGALLWYARVLGPILVCSVLAYYIMYYEYLKTNFIANKFSFEE